jgi:hypothetical protein
VVVHAPAPPVGLVDTTALPSKSTATHNAADGQVIAVKPPSLSAFAAVQVGDPLLGSVEVSTLPTLSTATHRAVEGQATSSKK